MCPPVAAAGRGPLPSPVPTGSVAECSSFASISLDAPAVSFACIRRYLRVPSERDSCGSRLHSPHLENSTSNWDAPSIEQARRGSLDALRRATFHAQFMGLHPGPQAEVPHKCTGFARKSRVRASVPQCTPGLRIRSIRNTQVSPPQPVQGSASLGLATSTAPDLVSIEPAWTSPLSPSPHPLHAFSCLVSLPGSSQELTTPSRLDVAPRKERSYGCPLPLVRQCIARRL